MSELGNFGRGTRMSQKGPELECCGREGTTESGSEEGPLVPWGRIRGTIELTSRERSQEKREAERWL